MIHVIAVVVKNIKNAVVRTKGGSLYQMFCCSLRPQHNVLAGVVVMLRSQVDIMIFEHRITYTESVIYEYIRI